MFMRRLRRRLDSNQYYKTIYPSTHIYPMMKTLILGIGNPVLGDDAVGIVVANKLNGKNLKNVDVETANTTVDIISLISGYDRVFVVDAVKTKNGKAGEIHKLGSENLRQTMGHSVHDIDLSTMLKTGEKLGIKMPEIIIYGVEVDNIDRFNEGLSKDVEAAVPTLVEKIMEELI
ncbi:MAG: hydrogenase maturation protease [Candidatus Thermoplasmatota archaeon]|nr:hydrogenase maturation protease [Candidatus Thermoplasmatota archaeon]